MPYESGEEEAVVGDVVVRGGRRGRVTSALPLTVLVDGKAEQWPITECRLVVPAAGIRPRPGWLLAWVDGLDRRAIGSVERAGVYLRRTNGDLDGSDDRFLVVDGRDDTSPHRLVGPRGGLESVDEAFRVADALIDEHPELLELIRVVQSAQPIVQDASAVYITDSTGDPALRVVVILPGRDLYPHEVLRAIRAAVTEASKALGRHAYTTFRLRSEMQRDVPNLAAEG